MSDSDPEEPGTAAAQTIEDGQWDADFEFPPNSKDLIAMFLDDDIAAARHQVHQQIEQNPALTQGAQQLQKAVVSIQAVMKQADRTRLRNRQQQTNRRQR